MSLPESETTITQLIASSPIHNCIDVGTFLELANLRHHLYIPFHELVIIRGKFPLSLNEAQQNQLSEEAIAILYKYELEWNDMMDLGETLEDLTHKWISENGIKP